MTTSTRFAVAAHVLSVLALNRDRAMTSETLAASARTNPAVVRRLLADLARAGLATSRLGKGGGASLAKAPKKISLLEIYRAVEAPRIVAMPRNPPDASCLVGRNIGEALGVVAAEAEAAFFAVLARTSLRDLARVIKKDAAA